MAEQQLSVDEKIVESETNTTLEKVVDLLTDKGIYPNDVQKQMLFL